MMRHGKSNPHVAAPISVDFNGAHSVSSNLDSLKARPVRAPEIILVESATTDESAGGSAIKAATGIWDSAYVGMDAAFGTGSPENRPYPVFYPVARPFAVDALNGVSIRFAMKLAHAWTRATRSIHGR